MARIGVAAAAQQVQPGAQTVEQRLRGQQLRAGSGQLEYQREAVEPLAKPVDRGGVRDVAAHPLRRCQKQADGLVRSEWRQVELRLGPDPKRLSAGQEQPQLRRSLDDRRNRPRGLEEKLLEVVEQDVRPLSAHPGGDRTRDLPPRSRSPRRARAGGGPDREGSRVARTPCRRRLLGEQTGQLDREPRLARASGADDREHARIEREHEGDGLEQLPLAAEDGVAGVGSNTVPGVRSGGCVSSPSWWRRVAPSKSLSRCAPRSTRLAPSSSAAVAAESRTWPPVCERGDTRAAMDVGADVPLPGRRGRARVQTHPHSDRPTGQRPLSGKSGGGRAGHRRERDEERVALRVDLDAAVRGECRPQRGAVLGEGLRVGLRSERVQEPRGAFDVRSSTSRTAAASRRSR